MFLNHKNPRIISFPTAFTDGQVTSEIHLIPGINKVEPAQLEAMKKHPTLKPLFDSGELEVISDSKGKEVVTLSEVEERQAMKMIEECNNPELLHGFLDAEKRGSVRRALEKKIKEMENPTTKEGA